MPNLSPAYACENYQLYDHKKFSGLESAVEIENINADMEKIGYEILVSRGDF